MSQVGDLPHAYPFRFVDVLVHPPDARFEGGVVSAGVTRGGRACVGESWGAPALLAETMAQAALLLQGGDPEAGRQGFLAGIDGFEVIRMPQAGEILRVAVRMAGRFGRVIRFESEVRSGSDVVARGTIVVREGAGVGPPAATPL